MFLNEASFPLLELMLRDAVHLQLPDIEWENKRRLRAGKELLEPLYELDDVEALLKLGQPVAYHEEKDILAEITVSFHEAGHLPGTLQTCFERRGWKAHIPKAGEKITF